MNDVASVLKRPLDTAKFHDARLTATGEQRASVSLRALDTLWFNTGTLCNITCENCYIESSPTNDRLSYLTLADVETYLEEITRLGLATEEIGFTGGEPFMNPDFISMLELVLARGFSVLILSNAMQPMMRKHCRDGLLRLKDKISDRMVIRVSLDHYTQRLHETERGPETWAHTLKGLRWLSENQFNINIAGRTAWGEDEQSERLGYANFFATERLSIDAHDPGQLILFPEMDETIDVPEITVDCWSTLGKNPDDVMCASSRMIVKRKGATVPTVVPCTLLPYQEEFDMGPSLKAAQAPVPLNHPHCAKFCVMGGGSCTSD
jgi:uncharacterized Fe-S cluster-containing radical SAM superfamily protein